MRGKHFSGARSYIAQLDLNAALVSQRDLDDHSALPVFTPRPPRFPASGCKSWRSFPPAFGSWQRCWTPMRRSRAWHSKRPCSNFPTGSRLMRANAPTFASAKLKIQKELNNAAGREAPASVSEGRALSEVHLTTSAPLVPRRHPRRMRWITCSNNAVYMGFTTPRCGERGANFGRADCQRGLKIAHPTRRDHPWPQLQARVLPTVGSKTRQRAPRLVPKHAVNSSRALVALAAHLFDRKRHRLAVKAAKLPRPLDADGLGAA
jgi:hypothetical protein